MELKLGCAYPPKQDTRTISFKALLRELPPIPTQYDAECDLIGKPFPARMWLNDAYGCCVIAAQANFTRVLEYIEQEKLINISDADIKREYFEQSGGADNGLYMLDAMNHWRKQGWTVTNDPFNKAKARGCWRKFLPNPTLLNLNIYSFAKMDSLDELLAAIYWLHGAHCAVLLKDTDMQQFRAGETWHLTGNDGDTVGGHAIYLPAYNGNILECWTWGKRQLMTAEWFMKRQYDMFGIVDNRDPWLETSPVDLEKLNAILQQIASN